MNRKRHGLCTLVAMGVVLSGTVLPISVGAASPPVGRKDAKTPSRKLDPREASTVASAGTRVLVCIAEARGRIREKDASRAREEIRKAEDLLNVVRWAIPTANAKDRVWVARRHLEYEDAQQVLPDLIPIDQELLLLQGFVSTAEARSHLEKARGFLARGDKQAALDELKAVDAALAYEEVDLPVSETEAHVSRALGELAIGETGKADSALQAAENSAQLIVSAARGPLPEVPVASGTQANEHTEAE
jgi:hypothetical protein